MRTVSVVAVVAWLGVAGCSKSSTSGSAEATAGSAAAMPSAGPSASAVHAASASPSSMTAEANTPMLPKHSGAKRPHAPGEPSIAIAGADEAGLPSARQESPASVGLPAVSFGAEGPLEVKGYPTPLEAGMRDYATMVAYTKDGSEVLACGTMVPLSAKGAEQVNTCYSRKHAGKTEHFGLEEGASGAYVGAAFAAKLALLKDAPPVTLRYEQAAAKLHPPPLKTTWPYASDITLKVDELAMKEGSNVLRIGGSVKGQEPVFPVTLAVQTKVPEVSFGGAWNAILASPDNTELAFIGHFFCMEWCNDVVIARLSYGKLASLVFNDTGFRLHQKKDFTGSRDLFLKATWADPRAPLPPYNLACAYALLNDEANAAKALKLAIAVGGDKVKARAKKDADFKGALAAKWFRDLTA